MIVLAETTNNVNFSISPSLSIREEKNTEHVGCNTAPAMKARWLLAKTLVSMGAPTPPPRLNGFGGIEQVQGLILERIAELPEEESEEPQMCNYTLLICLEKLESRHKIEIHYDQHPMHQSSAS